jgi:hypothetical protein
MRPLLITVKLWPMATHKAAAPRSDCKRTECPSRRKTPAIPDASGAGGLLQCANIFIDSKTLRFTLPSNFRLQASRKDNATDRT